VSYHPLNAEGETYTEALNEEATRPLPVERSLQDILAERRSLVLEQAAESDAIARELLQFEIDKIDREVHGRLTNTQWVP
jgi:hypothetical protein